MPMPHSGLAKLCEECGELQTVAAKLLTYPKDDIHPDGSIQHQRLTEEIADVLAAIDFVALKRGLDRDAINARRGVKLGTYMRWDAEHYSRHEVERDRDGRR